jgi:hypothetical protein
VAGEQDGVKLVLLVVGVATASALATALLANLVVNQAVERVVQEANAKKEQPE